MRVIKPYEPSAEEIRREWAGTSSGAYCSSLDAALDSARANIRKREKRNTIFYLFLGFAFGTGVALAALFYVVMQ